MAGKQITAFALEAAPRTTRAQSMDVLSSQANIAGYKAVMLAANTYQRFMPMLMTAAGTVKAARVLILGAGVAGLQAIATANISLKVSYPQFKYKSGYEKGVVDADYSAQVLNPLPNAVSYTIDTNYFKIFTTAGFQFNKNDGSISGKPKRNGYVYLDILANDINNKPIGTASILIFIKKASTVSITNSTASYNYNNKPQGPSNTTTTGSSGTVTFNYKGIDNDYNASSLPKNAGE
jgi:hypothetical protein